MGVQCRIVAYAPGAEPAADAARAAFAELARLEGVFSDYRDSSEVSALARAAGVESLPVSADLVEVLTLARRVHDATGGAFDVTVGPASRLWRESRRTSRPPDNEALRAARDLIDGTAIRVDASARTVMLERPGMCLDLGGIAKGYSAQRALAVLARRGLPCSMVALAGDVAAGDPPPGAAGWRIGTPPALGLGSALLLSNTSVSTSGDEEQSVVIEGRHSSHLLDPRTGWSGSPAATTTVVCRDGAVADALATAIATLDQARAAQAIGAFPGAAALSARPGGRATCVGSVSALRWVGGTARP